MVVSCSVTTLCLSGIGVVVRRRKKKHVIDTINFCSDNDYAISIRSGGHQYSGYSSGTKNTLILDVSGLKTFSLDLDTSRATIGAGVHVYRVYQRLGQSQLTIPMGMCSNVAAGGHLCSSSVGYLYNKYGSGMNYVESFRIVTSDGRLRTVTQESDADLYWAVLGGPPGSWGVVLDTTVKCIEVKDHQYTRQLKLIFMWSPDLFVKIQQMTYDMRNETQLTLFLHVSPSSFMVKMTGDTRHYISLEGIWAGTEKVSSTYTDFVSKLRECNPLPTPFPNMDTNMSLSAAMGGQTISFDHDTHRYLVASRILDTSKINDEHYFQLVANTVKNIIESDYPKYIVYQCASFDDKGKEKPSEEQIVFNTTRGNTHFIDLWCFYDEDTSDDTFDDQRRILREFTYKKLGKYVGDNANRAWLSTDTLNTDVSLHTKWSEYIHDKHTYDRLRRIKKKVDPMNLFRSKMTIDANA